MAVNKNALIRYQYLDNCFRKFDKKFYFDELLEGLNKLLISKDAASQGVKVRQLRDDIRFMKSKEGYSAPIFAYKEGRKAYYRYEIEGFSIVNSPINSSEIDQLQATFLILDRLKAGSEYAWLSEIAPKLQSHFNFQESKKNYLCFEKNGVKKGLNHLTKIYDAIVNKTVLKIVQSNQKGKESQVLFHPYFLKQYMNRWYAFGRNESTFDNKYMLPLEEIKVASETSGAYLQTSMDWNDYFYNVIGVIQSSDPVQEIQLIVDASQSSFILSNPIHSSQTTELNENGSLTVRLKVKPNLELERRILAYGEFIEVIFPITLKHRLNDRIKKMLER